ncbi:MAG TPA: alpha/beta hydrolase [Umezawaea sp.]|nr:alpha/beta hydrolase [Umezawaea sp.]
MTVHTGLLAGRSPHVSFGSGAPLVVLVGLTLDSDVPGPLLARAYARGFRALAEHHTVHVVQRPRGFEGVDDYAAVLREIGRASVVGLSTGGAVAQHLALDHPDLVERLVLVVSGARLAPRGREICLAWRALADAGRWRDLRASMAAVAVDGRIARGLAHAAGWLSGGAEPLGLRDFRALLDLVLAHDTTGRLSGLAAPALVIGGSADPFFPAGSLRATASAMPDAVLKVVEGSGHGLAKQRAALWQDEVVAFTAGSQA